ncbi:MAG TPA: SRPBCC domain-containing protein [Mucilaginibacter sp.]|jgi:uncharacterized protein YndB with AHSA1/START domain|nr:SRPBCC domain-containing protein [Mucilaginibacter sp.]
MGTKSNLVDNPVRQEVNITRIFDAPRELVFKMWTDPELVEKWWGPKDFKNPVCELDARVGGTMRIVMQAPDGLMIPTSGVFTELLEPERIVFKNFKEDDDGNAQLEVINTVTFTEENGKTTMTLNALAVRITPEACASIEGMNVGWNQSIDRFAYVLTGINH